MDKTLKYKELAKNILQKYVDWDNEKPSPTVDYILIADDESGNYFWLNLGWTKNGRINKPTVHLRIRNEKIWIEEDWTEHGIANDFLDADVPKEDIVLAFYSPQDRIHTEFATV